MIKIIIAIIILIGSVSLLIFSTNSMLKKSKEDWDTLKELEEKAEEISNMEELIIFHKEFMKRANKIHNKYIIQRLSRIDGYCRGLYKSFKTNKL